MFIIPDTVFGLLAMIILTLASVVVRQYNDNKALQSKFNDLQDARRVDAVETADKVIAPLSNLSQTMPLILAKLQDGK